MNKTGLLLFIYVLLIFSCKNETPNNYAIISGKIKNNNSLELKIASVDNLFEKKIQVNKDGTFIDTLNIDSPIRCLFNDLFEVYLEKGYNLTVSFDLEKPYSSVLFTGKGSQFNQYLVASGERVANLVGDPSVFYKLGNEEFVAKINLIKNVQEGLLDSISNLSAELSEKEKQNIHYSYLLYLQQHNRNNNDVSKPKSNMDIYDELKSLDYENIEDFKFSFAYNWLVYDYYDDLITNRLEKDSMDRNKAFFDVISKVSNDTIRNSLFYEDANSNLSYGTDLEKYYLGFMENSTNEDHKRRITESYKKLKSLSAGGKSPEFIDYSNFKGGVNSLSDFRGQYLYIDVWATWCAPCLAEVPSLKKLEIIYENSNITFLSISVDRKTDFKKWRSTVERKELSGVQLFASNSWKSKFIEDYNIFQIPRFIFIDPNGKIINPDAPGPSNAELVELFNLLEI